MTQTEAEKLLGGYATGTLTEAERKLLFAAALARQELFDALVDEEALRELLADPTTKAQILAALAPAAPKVIPLWRRTGVLGAAAGLIVAATAGLAYYRSPERVHPLLGQEREQPAKAKAAEPPAVAQAPTLLARKALAPPAPASVPATPAQERAANLAPPPPRPVTAAGAAPAVGGDLRAKEQDQDLRAEARDSMAKKAEASRSSAALMEVVPAPRADKQKGRVEAQSASTFAPTWSLEPQPDGSTWVLVQGPSGSQVVLLRRRASAVAVLALQVIDSSGDRTRWRAEVRLATSDVLDLYLLNAAVANPARLPETGPVDGFRVRIHPASKN